MNKIKFVANRETNYVFHMLSVAKCGYDNAYGDFYRALYPEEDLNRIKAHEELLTVCGGEHSGFLYGMLVATPACGNVSAKDYYARLLNMIQKGEIPDGYESYGNVISMVSEVMIKHYDYYVEHIWENGAEAIDISDEQDVFGIVREPLDAFYFMGHEFIIYLLFSALKDENAFKSFETWDVTEGLAEYYLKKIMGDTRFFNAQRKYVELFEECEKEHKLSAVELYQKGICEIST